LQTILDGIFNIRKGLEDLCEALEDLRCGKLCEAKENLVEQAMSLLFDEKRCKELSENIGRLGKPRAAEDIVTEIEKLLV